MPIETVGLKSSAINQISYDSETKELTVQFAKGGEETLRNITPQQFRQFRDAPSAGRFYNQHFRSSGDE